MPAISTSHSGPPIDAAHDDDLTAMVEECGFSIERRGVVEQLHYATEDWLNMVFTYSNVLTLDRVARAGCGHGSRSASARAVWMRETMPWRSSARPNGDMSWLVAPHRTIASRDLAA